MAEWENLGKIRMTPKGTHDSTITYNILDFVTNSNNTKCYIAKQNVPIGIELTNTAYWTPILETTRVSELNFNVQVTTLAEGENATGGINGNTLILGIPRGNTGHTPERGVDYWTSNDRTSIINETIAGVLDTYPAAEEASF